MNFKIYIIVILCFLVQINKEVNSDIYIKAKVNNEIITNFDIETEKNYLFALNPKLKELSSVQIERYAIDSIINERIKKIEITKKFEIVPNIRVLQNAINNIHNKLGIKDLASFKSYLNEFNIDLELVKDKISIEIAWNDLIVKKFNNSILIDEEKIREKIKKQNENLTVELLLLSELIFTIQENEKFDNKINKIKNSINNIGFEETAKIYSISNSKFDGGNIGWVNKNQLSKNVVNQLDKISVGEFTDPITTSGGFILLKINESKNEKIKLNEQDQLRQAINFETDRQLTRYSTFYYKRVYNKAVINEF